MMIKQFSRGGGRGYKFFKEVEIFQGGFQIVSGGVELRFIMRGVLEVT